MGRRLRTRGLKGTRETGNTNSAGVTITDPNQHSEHKADRDGAFFDAGAATAPSVVAQRAVEQSAGNRAATAVVQRARGAAKRALAWLPSAAISEPEVCGQPWP
ncbi:hypothetical protein [Streptomyces brasiliensis]|uniref:Uncharacterized protein n=1 Tax=Streptomyces brasiliensis TaxID=1954 RepID=A0A917P6R5_9ACTN|nr:hypothetical protein [Streptomyces brasiliensis]GGJ64470.1 hypothetical protein GCM10010121_088920 [Streptomyces brasiliensis]